MNGKMRKEIIANAKCALAAMCVPVHCMRAKQKMLIRLDIIQYKCTFSEMFGVFLIFPFFRHYHHHHHPGMLRSFFSAKQNTDTSAQKHIYSTQCITEQLCWHIRHLWNNKCFLENKLHFNEK